MDPLEPVIAIPTPALPDTFVKPNAPLPTSPLCIQFPSDLYTHLCKKIWLLRELEHVQHFADGFFASGTSYPRETAQEILYYNNFLAHVGENQTAEFRWCPWRETIAEDVITGVPADQMAYEWDSPAGILFALRSDNCYACLDRTFTENAFWRPQQRPISRGRFRAGLVVMGQFQEIELEESLIDRGFSLDLASWVFAFNWTTRKYLLACVEPAKQIVYQ